MKLKPLGDGCLTEIERLRDRGKTVVSHDLNQVERLCSQILWLDGGRVRAVGGSARILAECGGQPGVGKAAAKAAA